MHPRNLFSGAGSPRDDAALLLEITEELLYGDDADRWREQLMQIGVNTAPALLQRLLAGELPPATLEVLAAMTCLCLPKDYNANPCREAVLTLASSLPGPHPPFGPTARSGAGEARMSRADELAFYLWLSGLLRQASAGRATDASEREVALTALRVLPLCGGSQHHDELRHHRSLLATADDIGISWAAPRAAFDVVGAGSEEALDELGALADREPTSPSLLWLDEFACRLAGRDARADQQASRLGELLASGSLGPNARSHAEGMLGMSREGVTEGARNPRAAWAQLAEQLGPKAPEPDEQDDLDEEEPDSGPSAREVFSGPFQRVRWISAEVRASLDGATHYLIMTFRLLRGLELLSPSAQRLAKSLSAGSD